MKMKKILCLTDNLSSGGAQRQLVGLACLLFDRNYDVEVLTYHDIPFYKGELDEHNIKNITLNTRRNIVMRFYKLANEIKKFSPDVLIAYQETPSLLACLLKLLFPNLKLIVSERNTTQKIKFHERLRFVLYQLSKYVVPNSQTQANFICNNYRFLQPKVRVITNYVNTKAFVPIEHYNYHGRILVVASSKIEKNFFRFVDAISILKHENIKFRVNWVGILDNKMDEYRNYLKQKCVDDIMCINPPCSNICEVYQQSDYFCLPSLFEGFPNVLCEAMSCGLPVVASRICDNPNIVEHGVNGFLFNPYSVPDIVEKIKQVLSLDEAELKKMRIYNRLKAESLFSPDTFINKYVDIIEN